MKTYVVAVREIVAVEYEIQAESMAEAIYKALNGEVSDKTGVYEYLDDDPTTGMSIEQLDTDTAGQVADLIDEDGILLGIEYVFDTGIDDIDVANNYIDEDGNCTECGHPANGKSGHGNCQSLAHRSR